MAGQGTRIEMWDASGVLDKTKDELVKRMTVATILVRDKAKVLVNRGNSTGKSPSKEGTPPKKVSGRLQSSLAQAVEVVENAVIGRVGTNVIYARRLELGFVGVDKAGRKISQGPRPFLRPAVMNNTGAIAKILGVKKR
jgi:phage gpG-like protein